MGLELQRKQPMLTTGAMSIVIVAALLLPHIVSHSLVAAKSDSETDFDTWVQNICNTSSSKHLQPPEYNPGWKPHKPHKKHHHVHHEGRNTLESTNSSTIVVAKDGSGQFKTVQAAVDTISKSNAKRVIIHVKAGVYKEKVKIDPSWITLLGDGPLLTEIQWGDTASSAGSTFLSASVAANGHFFTARDISFRNTAPPPSGGAVGKQAVAFRASGDAAAFYNVNFYGAQDTLYDHEGRHYFSGCYIEGSIDFIFGDGRSFYLQCRLHSIASPYGSLTAQNRPTPSQNTGFSFVKCVVTGSGNIYLGRAWGKYSRVVYSSSYFANIILPVGWMDWNDPSRDKTVFYGEYQCYGPGANRAGRVPWSKLLTAAQAAPFLNTGFINGEKWLSQT